MSKEVVSKSQLEVLDLIRTDSHLLGGDRVDGWVSEYDFPYFIKRAGYLCEILVRKGYLETRYRQCQSWFRLKREED